MAAISAGLMAATKTLGGKAAAAGIASRMGRIGAIVDAGSSLGSAAGSIYDMIRMRKDREENKRRYEQEMALKQREMDMREQQFGIDKLVQMGELQDAARKRQWQREFMGGA